MKRRNFIKQLISLTAVGYLAGTSCARSDDNKNTRNLSENNSESSEIIFETLINKALAEGWDKLPIGDCIGKIALELLDTPYVGYTLEGPGPEICRIDLTGLDCVTFVENTLDIARILKKGKSSLQDLFAEVTYSRYRDGKIEDYASRLHYSSDWIYDNIKKEVIEDITKKCGGIIYPVKVYYMSRYPKYYQALKDNPQLIPKIAKIENEINSRKYYYIPKVQVEKAEQSLQTGDIIVFATNIKGMDYSHLGFAYRMNNGEVHLIHASSKQKKVYLDNSIHEYIAGVNKHIGITVVRPIFPDIKIY